MTDLPICPHCQSPFPSDAPEGVCPRCVLNLGLSDSPLAEEPAATEALRKGAFRAPTASELAEHFPQLEIERLIGVGGMGAVYQARQPGLDRKVALKILPAEMGEDASFAERFSREAKALARLSHPNIVAVYDFGQAAGYFYFLMEYVDGANLRQLMESEGVPADQALGLVQQVCDALQYAHDEKIVHRDIKPENILIDTRGRVKIADFGLAKILQRAPADLTLTGTRQVVGTLHYMAPEQMERPLSVDHRADIYSLGVVFYELLTGELPLGRFAPPSDKARVDVGLDDVVLRSLEKDPERRYQHASDVKLDVARLSSPDREAAERAVEKPPWPAPDKYLVSAPFRLRNFGVTTAEGIVRCDGGELTFEFVEKSQGFDAAQLRQFIRYWKTGDSRPDLITVRIPLRDVLSMDFAESALGFKLTLQYDYVRCSAFFPQSPMGRVNVLFDVESEDAATRLAKVLVECEPHLAAGAALEVDGEARAAGGMQGLATGMRLAAILDFVSAPLWWVLWIQVPFTTSTDFMLATLPFPILAMLITVAIAFVELQASRALHKMRSVALIKSAFVIGALPIHLGVLISLPISVMGWLMMRRPSIRRAFERGDVEAGDESVRVSSSDIDDASSTEVAEGLAAPGAGLILAGFLNLFPLAGIWFFIGMSLLGHAPPRISPWDSLLPFILFVVHAPIAALLIWAGSQIRRVQSRVIGIAASVVAIIPIHIGTVIGIPMGIYALVRLLGSNIEVAFRDAARQRNRSRPAPYEKKIDLDEEDPLARLRTPASMVVLAGLLNLALAGLISLISFTDERAVTPGGRELALIVYLLIIGVFLAVAGALLMKRKFYGVALTCALLSLIPLSPTWLLSSPFSLSALFTLSTPDARGAFGRPVD